EVQEENQSEGGAVTNTRTNARRRSITRRGPMTVSEHHHARGSAAGNAITLLLLLGLIGLGAWLWLGKKPAEQHTGAQTSTAAAVADGKAPAPIEPVDGTPTLEAAATSE